MKQQSKKLSLIAIIAFICFLIAFAMAFYEYGSYSYFESLVTAFIIAIYYFVLTVVALIYMHTPPIYKRSYIIMSILSTAFIAVLDRLYFYVDNRKFTALFRHLAVVPHSFDRFVLSNDRSLYMVSGRYRKD